MRKKVRRRRHWLRQLIMIMQIFLDHNVRPTNCTAVDQFSEADQPPHALIMANGDNDHGYHLSNYGPIPISDSARCFSCMSRLYEAVWPALTSIYKRPKNFTDQCDDQDLEPLQVPITFCPTICIRMWEEPIVAGIRIKGHIRGCLDELLHNGFNQTIISWYRWMHRDSCRQYRKRELFMLSPEVGDDSLITVCTCYADYCNGKSSGSSSASKCSSFIAIFWSQLLTIIIVHTLQRI